MLALNDIIDFLLDLLRDADARAAFEHDPHAALADAGLQDVTAHDVRDARLLLADSGAAQPHGTAPHHAGGDDPIREIRHTAQHFHAVPGAAPAPTISIDDRDTFFVRNVDSHDVTIIEDSFNAVDASTDNSTHTNNVVAIQDNDTINQTGPDAGSTPPDGSAPGAPDPGTPAGPLPADAAPDPGPLGPGSGDPGAADPSATDPSTTDPGATDPGTTDPGTADPASGIPDGDPHSDPDPGVDPTAGHADPLVPDAEPEPDPHLDPGPDPHPDDALDPHLDPGLHVPAL